MVRTYIKPALAGALLLGMTTAALAGEFGNSCAYGLSQGKKMSTDCSVNATLQGKQYCFSSEDAMASFMTDYKANISKANDYYKELEG